MRHSLVYFPRHITQLTLEWQHFRHAFGRLRNLFPAWMKGTGGTPRVELHVIQYKHQGPPQGVCAVGSRILNLLFQPVD